MLAHTISSRYMTGRFSLAFGCTIIWRVHVCVCVNLWLHCCYRRYCCSIFAPSLYASAPPAPFSNFHYFLYIFFSDSPWERAKCMHFIDPNCIVAGRSVDGGTSVPIWGFGCRSKGQNVINVRTAGAFPNAHSLSLSLTHTKQKARRAHNSSPASNEIFPSHAMPT